MFTEYIIREQEILVMAIFQIIIIMMNALREKYKVLYERNLT